MGHPELTAVHSSGNGTHVGRHGKMDLVAMIKASCAMQTMVHFVGAIILFPKALIMAVNGPAYGVAVTHALLDDLLGTNEKTIFTTPFTKLGQNRQGWSSVAG